MVNFRMFENKTIEFDSTSATLRGVNGSGKSTILTAISWVFFDKDQFGRKDFEIKPLTPSGEPKHYLDSTVIMVLDINGETVTLKKIFHEKWTKPKGQTITVFGGHETLYYCNGVPVTMREYNTKIETICPESLFTLLTNPLHFPNTNWTEQRSMLFKIAGTVDDSAIAAGNPAWEELLKELSARKTMDEYKREIASEKRKIKDDKEKIPARIDEVHRGLPEPENYQQIENEIREKKESLQAIDKEISDLSAGIEKESQEYMEKQKAVSRKKMELQNAEFEVQKRASRKYLELFSVESDKRSKLKNLQFEKERLEKTIESLDQDRKRYISQREGLKQEYYLINGLKEIIFDDGEFVCPTCKRTLEESDKEARKEKLIASHNAEKARKIEINVTKGRDLSNTIESIDKQISEANIKISEVGQSITDANSDIESVKVDISLAEKQRDNWRDFIPGDDDCLRLSKEIQAMEAAVGVEPKSINITDQTARKEVLQRDINDLSVRLSKRDAITKANARIAELTQELKTLSQREADIERIEDDIRGFVRAKINSIEEKVNNMFSIVKFKLFDTQVNGEEVETCQVMVDGVSYRNLNNAGRIQAGLDIINTFSDYYGIYAPCTLDNRESVTDIPSMKSQVINLVVDPLYSTLCVQ